MSPSTSFRSARSEAELIDIERAADALLLRVGIDYIDSIELREALSDKTSSKLATIRETLVAAEQLRNWIADLIEEIRRQRS